MIYNLYAMEIHKKIAVKLSNVEFGYDHKTNNRVIKNLSFDIYDDEYICIVGSNGSGKSTISKIIFGLLKPWSGNVYVYGTLMTNLTLKSIRNKIGIVFQNPDNQFIGLTAEDDIAFGLENRLVNSLNMNDIIQQASSIVSVQHLLGLDAGKLSGGQKQRVAIASVLAMNPSIIIFDESTSMLDPTAKQEIKELMLLLRHKYHKTVISITHDMEEIIKADRVMVIKQGELQRFDKPSVVFEDEEFLKNNSLDFPFTLNLSKLLKDKYHDLSLTLDSDKLATEVAKLCKK